MISQEDALNLLVSKFDGISKELDIEKKAAVRRVLAEIQVELTGSNLEHKFIEIQRATPAMKIT